MSFKTIPLRIWLLFIVLALGRVTHGQSDGSLLEQAKAILEQNCVSCHGAAQMSGLDMRNREAMLKGGERGPALIPGRADSSPLYLAAAHQQEPHMPPQQDALAVADLEVLRKWIDAGAQWEVRRSESAPTQNSWWSFRRPSRPAPPQVRHRDWVRNPIDAFVLVRLGDKGLPQAPPAEPTTLIRRLYFDLIGLPPTPEEVEAFLKDSSPKAYETLVNQLLESPRYGERWGRHWLDVVRYADSGGFETDEYFPNAWRYRDYVIKSLNEDKPYDRFLQEQIAGDELWPNDLDLQGSYAVPEEKLLDLEARVATGLYSLTPQAGESRLSFRKDLYEKLTDWVDTTGSAFLGLTFGCARCHDHKFDPITQRDYFRMQAAFANTRVVEIPVVTKLSRFHRHESYSKLLALAEARLAFDFFEREVAARVIAAKKAEFPAKVVQAYEDHEEEFLEGRYQKKWIPERRQQAQPLIEALQALLTPGTDRLKDLQDHLSPDEKEQRQELVERVGLAALEIPAVEASHKTRYDAFFDLPAASVFTHRPAELVPDIHILDRGELGRRKDEVRAGLPAVLKEGVELAGGSRPEDSRRTRKKLALWLTRPDHPLTSRVMVNRIWQWHFGAGLVPTSNDFGRMGQRPSHPLLLDWLATEFVSLGWSVKSLHRLILFSSTYQMSSRFFDKAAAAADPDNRYLWKMNRRRLESEAIWDATHAVAGNLNLKMGGRPVCPPLGEEKLTGKNWYVPSDPSEQNRRAVYIMIQRNFGFPMFETFDSPDPAASCPGREETTVAPQALWLLNDDIAFEQARGFAQRVRREAGDQPRDWVERAWRIALARGPSPQERREALQLLDSLAQNRRPSGESPESTGSDGPHNPDRLEALTRFCLALMNLNEFLYVD